MKAKKLVGVITSAALTFSMVFGGVMPVGATETDAPAAEAPAAETPVVETPAAEAPATVETPAAEAPAVETPAAEEPAVETPVAEEPAVETPVVEEPAAETPAEEAVPEEEEVVEEAAPEADELTDGGSITLELTALSDDEGTVGIAASSIEASQVVEAAAPAYTGIEINGDFTQWDGVEKATVEDGSVKKLAMVFDGDVYVYVQGYEEIDWGSNDVATGAGIHSDGMFAITTDTGRMSVFYIRTDGVYDRMGNLIEGAEIAYNGTTKEYEVKLPASFVKQYKETISLGYYLDALTDENGNVVTDEDGNQIQRQIVSDVADLSQAGLGTTPNEIEFDGLYGDWDSYSHELIEYSTYTADAEGAMYSDGDTLNMHVKTYLSGQSPYLYKDITLRFNRNDNQCVNLTVVAVDDQGNVMWNTEGLYDTTAGKNYHYYLVDENAWGMGGQNIYNESTYWNWNQTERVRWLYGEILVSVGATGTEMEVQVDMAELANRLGVDATDLKYIQAQFENIGQQWISCAGTSTGPLPGILMGAGIAAFAAWGYKKKEKGVVEA